MGASAQQLHPLGRALDAWGRRLGLRRGLVRAGWVVLGGAGFVGLLTALAVWVPLPALVGGSVRASLGVLGGVALLAASVPLWVTRFGRAQAAAVADLRLETRALFTTAEEALVRQARGEALTEAEEACLGQASTRAAQTPASQVAPMRFGARWGVGALPLLLGAALALAPFAADVRSQEEQAKLALAAQELSKVEKKIEEGKKDGVGVAVSPELERKVQRLRQKLQQGELTPREAMEQLSELKQEVRAERADHANRAGKSAEGAKAAGEELSRSKATENLGKKLGQAAQSAQASPEERQKAEQGLQEEVRKLSKLSKEERAEAAQQLKQASKAAGQAGDTELSEALSDAAQALANEDQEGLEQASEQVAGAATKEALTQEELEQLAQGLEQAQQQLAGQKQGQQGQQGQGKGQGGGDESRIAPGDRDWKAGKNGGKDGQGAAGAGEGHSDEEAPGKETGGHQDATRFNDKERDAWVELYDELHEAQLLNSDGRIATKVQGERSQGGKVDTLKGGEQAPREERARKIVERLPAQYVDEAREEVGGEQIPPSYRDAVKDYFDPKQ